MASYTKEQEQIVIKTLSYKSHQYYEVLAVLKTSSETDIKKSYRKLAIKLHPDKNPHPRSSEAFKLLNKAWGVLSDSNKKHIYDQTGVDPDSRGGGGGSSSGGSGAAEAFARAAAGGQRFQGGGNVNEDLFNMFFGGGGMPGQAGGPTFMFGNNGFTYSFGGNGMGGGDPFFQNVRQRRGQQRGPPRGAGYGEDGEDEGSILTTLRHLIPIFLFLLVPFLSAIFSESSIPEYSFSATRKFNTMRTTPVHSIPFYVEKNFAESKNLDALKLQNFDQKVESMYIQDKRSKCSREQVRKNELLEDAEGWFFTDQVKLEQANNMPMPNCNILRGMNLL